MTRWHKKKHQVLHLMTRLKGIKFACCSYKELGFFFFQGATQFKTEAWSCRVRFLKKEK
jgi:hypothetical protein